MKRLAKRIVSVAALTVCGSTNAFAHPIHTTLTKVTHDEKTITLNIRSFADDFSATVAKFAGRAAPKDSSAPLVDVINYARAQFTVTDAAGRSVQLESCGVRRADELYWLCFKATFASSTKGARIRNQMLTELHPDQVNIVQLEGAGTRRTMLFTKGSAPSVIGD